MLSWLHSALFYLNRGLGRLDGRDPSTGLLSEVTLLYGLEALLPVGPADLGGVGVVLPAQVALALA